MMNGDGTLVTEGLWEEQTLVPLRIPRGLNTSSWWLVLDVSEATDFPETFLTIYLITMV
jgi:hypothetical protein